MRRSRVLVWRSNWRGLSGTYQQSWQKTLVIVLLFYGVQAAHILRDFTESTTGRSEESGRYRDLILGGGGVREGDPLSRLGSKRDIDHSSGRVGRLR